MVLQHVSVTDLSAYNWCQRGLYLRKVHKLREPAKPIMVLGSVRHKVYDEINKKEEMLVKQVTSGMQRTDAVSLFSSAYTALVNKSVLGFGRQLGDMGLDSEKVREEITPVFVQEAMQRADEILSFATAKKVFGDELWEALTPKVMTEVRVTSGILRLKGVVDRIEVYGKEYVPVEIKTGRAPATGVWPDHRMQVAAYMLLLKEKFGARITEGLVKYVAAGQTRQIVMNPFMEYEVNGAVNKVFSLLEQEDVPGYCNRKEHCGVCSLGEQYEGGLIKSAY
jgi:CRISPR-associated protein Cas4